MNSVQIDRKKGRTTRAPVQIALIIVCRNALPALMRTVESIKLLADDRVLPIVIDGASTDGTANWLDTLGAWTYQAISEPDLGIYDAMNKGWAFAPRGAFILFLGAGDLLYELPPDQSMLRPTGDLSPLLMGETLVGDALYRSRWVSEMRLRNTAHHQSVLINKSVSEDPPFDTRLRVYADWDFNLRLYRRGLQGRYVSGFRTYAEPGGASWYMPLAEIRFVARRHSGWIVGIVSWTLNGITRWRRARRDARKSAIVQRFAAEQSSN